MLIYLISTDKALLTALHHLINYTDKHTSEICTSPAQLFNRVKQNSPDLIVTGLRLKETDGIELISALKQINKKHKVLVCGNTNTKTEIYRAFAAGACGFISKKESPSIFIEALPEIEKGKTIVCNVVKTILADYFKDNPDAFLNRGKGKLSNREIQIIELMAEGLQHKQIADKLNISTNTMKTHSNNILKKLNAHNKITALKNYFAKK